MSGLSQAKRKLIDRLRSRKTRRREGLFLAEGARVVEEALRATSPRRIRFAVRSTAFTETSAGLALMPDLDGASFPVVEVSHEEFGGISDTTTPQGILLVVEEPADPVKVDGEDADPLWAERVSPPPRILILDGVRDPGNAGTLLRAAWGFGLGAAVFLDGSVDPWSPKVVRAGAGAHFHLDVVRRTWSRTRAGWISSGLPLLVADSAGKDVRSAPVPDGWVLVVGNEADGVRQEIREASDGALAVRIAKGVDSLNAGVAGAILLFALSAGGDPP